MQATANALNTTSEPEITEEVILIVGPARDRSNEYLLAPFLETHKRALSTAEARGGPAPRPPVIVAVDLKSWLSGSVSSDGSFRTKKDELREVGFTDFIEIDDDHDGGMNNPRLVRQKIDEFLHRSEIPREVSFAYIYQEMYRTPLFPAVRDFPHYKNMPEYRPHTKSEVRQALQTHVLQPRFAPFTDPKKDRGRAVMELNQFHNYSGGGEGIITKGFPSGNGYGLFLIHNRGDFKKAVDWYAEKMLPFKGIPATDFVVEEYLGVGRNLGLHVEAQRDSNGVSHARIVAWSEKLTRLVESPIPGIDSIDEVGHVLYSGETANEEMQRIADSYVQNVGNFQGVCHIDLWSPLPERSIVGSPYHFAENPPHELFLIEAGDRPSGNNVVELIRRLNLKSWLWNLSRGSLSIADEPVEIGPRLESIGRLTINNRKQARAVIPVLAEFFQADRLAHHHSTEAEAGHNLSSEIMKALDQTDSPDALEAVLQGLPIRVTRLATPTTSEILSLHKTQQPEVALSPYAVVEFWGSGENTRNAMTKAGEAMDQASRQTPLSEFYRSTPDLSSL